MSSAPNLSGLIPEMREWAEQVLQLPEAEQSVYGRLLLKILMDLGHIERSEFDEMIKEGE